MWGPPARRMETAYEARYAALADLSSRSIARPARPLARCARTHSSCYA